MLTIRNGQLQALGHPAREQFIQEMAGHVRSHFPKAARSLTPDALRDRVRKTIERAAAYRLTSQRQVCRYINLAATYGWEFDSDPCLPWMRDILVDDSLSEPEERLDRLVQVCLHRESVMQHNRSLWRQLDRRGEAPLVS